MSVVAGLWFQREASSPKAGLVPAPPATSHPRDGRRVSGAYEALGEWAIARAYPERNVPAGAFERAVERAASDRRSLADEFTGRGSAGPAAPAGLSRARALEAQAVSWQPIGPVNGAGRTLTLAFHPSDPNILYAGSASGGLWRSMTGGAGAAAWQRIETGFPALGVGAIAFEPGNPSVMYIGTGEVYNHQLAGDLEADRATRGSYGVGILKSIDGGATWAKSLDWSYGDMHGVWAIRVHPTDPDIVWAATTDGVYKSDNAGASWARKLAVVMAMDLKIHPERPDTLVAACGNLSSAGHGLYRTTDGGENWANITGGGLPSTFAGKIQLATTSADSDLLFASIGNGFEVFGPDNRTWLVRSLDFGATWSLRDTTDYSKWQGWYGHDVAIHPLYPDTLICVGIDVWKSADGGLTLAQKSDYRNFFGGVLAPGGPEGLPNYSHADHHDVVFHPTNPGTLYVTNDGGVFRSLDGGQTFEGVNGGYQNTQFYNGTVSLAADPNGVMGGLQDNGSAIYQGGGVWARWILGGDGGWAAIDPSSTNVVYATAQWLFVGKSVDGGATFGDVSPPALAGPVTFIAPLVMSPTNGQVLYGGSSYLFKTFNGGGQWFVGKGGQQIDGNPLLLLAVAPANDAVLYLASAPFASRGRVHRSTNGGGAFTDITGTLPDRYPGDMVVSPAGEGIVYITMSGFGSSHVFKSTDYGATWTDIDAGGLPDVPAHAITVDPVFTDHLYVGNDIGVFFTANGGANWVQLADGLPPAVLVADLSVSPSNRMLRLMTHGNGAYERDLVGANVSVEGPDPRTPMVRLLPGVPNPFHSATEIRFDLTRAGEVDLMVFDARGARVRTLARGAMGAGSHRIGWNGRDDRGRIVAAGSYFVRLVADGAAASQRIVRVE